MLIIFDCYYRLSLIAMYTCRNTVVVYEFHRERHYVNAFTWERGDKIYVYYGDLLRILHIDCRKHADEFDANITLKAFHTEGNIYVEEAIDISNLPGFIEHIQKHAYSCPKCKMTIKALDDLHDPRRRTFSAVAPTFGPLPHPTPSPATFGAAGMGPFGEEPPAKRVKFG